MAGGHQAKKDGDDLNREGFWLCDKFRIRGSYSPLPDTGLGGLAAFRCYKTRLEDVSGLQAVSDDLAATGGMLGWCYPLKVEAGAPAER